LIPFPCLVLSHSHCELYYGCMYMLYIITHELMARCSWKVEGYDMFVGFMPSIGRILGNSFKYELSFGLQVKLWGCFKNTNHKISSPNLTNEIGVNTCI
jgi:hypothetical protein